jgi:hypothetical protein
MTGSSSEESLAVGAPAVRGFDDPSGSFEKATVLEKRPKVVPPPARLPPLRLPSGTAPTVAIPAPAPRSRTASRRAVGHGLVRRYGPIVIASLASLLLGLQLGGRPPLEGLTVTVPTLPASPASPAPTPAQPVSPPPVAAPAPARSAPSAAAGKRARRLATAGKSKSKRKAKPQQRPRPRARGRSR